MPEQGKKLVKVFHQGKAESRILDGIDIEIYEKDFTVIMGPSGAGKSTLLYALSGMDRISGGSVLYAEDAVSMENQAEENGSTQLEVRFGDRDSHKQKQREFLRGTRSNHNAVHEEYY